jgi:prophage maintenance system killer protein
MSDHMSELVLYRSKDGAVQLDVQLEKETIWLTQKQMGLLFGKDSDTIGLHIRNIYKEGELEESATAEDSSVVQQEGRRKVARKVRFYNLDAILSVGYRVNSKRGTDFRIWATNVLKQHIVQSFDGKDVYSSVEEKAAHLLYFMVKNHSFVDGNKRIAAAVFLRFADKNGMLRDREGGKRIADNALVAMTLMIAESRAQEKAVITAMLTNLIGGVR